MPSQPPRHTPPGHAERLAKIEAERTRYNSQHVYNYAWRKFRGAWIKANPLCARCRRVDGMARPATQVHHIVCVTIDPTRVLDPSNVESTCTMCHGIMSGIERRSKQ